MSESDDGEVNRREVAYRLFAAEFEDANLSYAESDEERAPNYVVTPTGARVNRVFVVGVLTEVEQVSEDVVRARVVDPTGAFVVYAGQYQPEALAALEAAETPSFVAVTGKARTFSPDDADVVYTSIRPEEVSEVDAETRDRWVVATAEQTVDRVATMAAAHERVERGENLREVLEAAGVQPGLAAGIPLALDHYGTTPAYLEAVRDLALDAARVVAGDIDSAGDLSLAPSEGGDADLAFAAALDVEGEAGATAAESADTEPEAGPVDADFGEPEAESEGESEPGEEAKTAGEADSESESGTEPEAESESEAGTEPEVESEPEAGTESGTESGSEAESEPESEPESGTEPAETGPAAETPDPEEVAAEAAPEGEEGAAGDGEMYELSEEERQEVKENYDVDFSTGTEVPDAGETDIDAPEPDEGASDEAEAVESDAEDDLGDFDADDEAQDEDADDLDDFTEDESDESASDAEDADAGSTELGLEDYVVELMDDLDDGDGALREEVVATAADERDADEGEIEDAIQEALMSGRCYESGDDHLKAI